jgi:hypothetical protein
VTRFCDLAFGRTTPSGYLCNFLHKWRRRPAGGVSVRKEHEVSVHLLVGALEPRSRSGSGWLTGGDEQKGGKMTESEWRDSDNPAHMVEFLGDRVTRRKARLFGTAYWRRSPHLSDPMFVEQLEKIEYRANHPDSSEAMEEDEAGADFLHWYDLFEELQYTDEPGWFANLVRDVFGNPFRSVAINPVWLTPTVTSLATAAYNERSLPSGELDSSRLAVLADALEKTGCTDADILGHLRSPGPHVRGCWAVDLLLGKA